MMLTVPWEYTPSPTVAHGRTSGNSRLAGVRLPGRKGGAFVTFRAGAPSVEQGGGESGTVQPWGLFVSMGVLGRSKMRQEGGDDVDEEEGRNEACEEAGEEGGKEVRGTRRYARRPPGWR